MFVISSNFGNLQQYPIKCLTLLNSSIINLLYLVEFWFAFITFNFKSSTVYVSRVRK